MDARLFHFPSPSDIVGLIEAGFEFDQNRDLFFIAGGGDEGVEEGGVAAGAVESHLNGENLGIGRGLFEERDDGLKTFVGMMEEDVVLPDGIEGAGGGCERRGDGGGEERIVEVRKAATRFSQGKYLGEIDGARHAVDILVGKVQMAEEIGFDFDGAILGEFKTNGGAPIPFLEFLFDGQEKVVGLFLVNIELAVASDAGGPGTMNLHSGEHFADKVADQFRKKNEIFRVASVLRKRNEAGNAAGNLNEGVAGGFWMTRFRKKDDEVD